MKRTRPAPPPRSSSSSSSAAPHATTPAPDQRAEPDPKRARKYLMKLSSVHDQLISIAFEAGVLSARRVRYPKSGTDAYALTLVQDGIVYRGTLYAGTAPAPDHTYIFYNAHPKRTDYGRYQFDLVAQDSWIPTGKMQGKHGYDPSLLRSVSTTEALRGVMEASSLVPPSPNGSLKAPTNHRYVPIMRATISSVFPPVSLKGGTLTKHRLEVFDGSTVLELWCFDSSERASWGDLSQGAEALFFDVIFDEPFVARTAKVSGGAYLLSTSGDLSGLDDHRPIVGKLLDGSEFELGAIDALPMLTRIVEVYREVIVDIRGPWEVFDTKGPFLFRCGRCKQDVREEDAPAHPCPANTTYERRRYCIMTLFQAEDAENPPTFCDVKCNDSLATSLGWKDLHDMVADPMLSQKLAPFHRAHIKVFHYPKPMPGKPLPKCRLTLLSLETAK